MITDNELLLRFLFLQPALASSDRKEVGCLHLLNLPEIFGYTECPASFDQWKTEHFQYLYGLLHRNNRHLTLMYGKQCFFRERQSAALMLGKSTAYDSARQMLMAALTDNKEILREYDCYREEE